MTRTLLLLLLLNPPAASADDPVVQHVDARKSGMGWRINVTLSHADTGWEHYADGWEVQDAAGNRLGYRELMHPHVHEQPFTRSLFDIMVPDGTRELFIRARCSQDGWSDHLTKITLRR